MSSQVEKIQTSVGTEGRQCADTGRRCTSKAKERGWNQPCRYLDPGLPASRTEEMHFWSLSCPVRGTLSRQLEQNNSASLYCPLWLSAALAFLPRLSESHWVIVSDSVFQLFSFCISLSSVYFTFSFFLYFSPVFDPLLFLCSTILSLPRVIRGTSWEMFRTAPVLQRLLEKGAALSPSLFSFLLHYFLSIPFSFTP